jgi:hypothetical protein
MTTTTSRRAVLAGTAAASTAATLPAIAFPAVQPDAELLALGRQLDRLFAMHRVACERYKPQWEVFSREAEKMAATVPNSNDAWEAMSKRVEAEYPVDYPHPDDIIDVTDGPSRVVMALPATTLAGLAVKARLAKFTCSKFWTETEEDADWDHLVLRSLVDAVLEQAGKAVQS